MSISNEIENIDKLMGDAYRGGLYKKANKFAERGIELATQIDDKKSLVNFLFWNGKYLYYLGKTDEAMPYLLKASQYEAGADPADIYNAVTTLISIVINNKSFQYVQKLIDDSREMLENKINREEWRHKLDTLNGRLEFLRGNYKESYEHYTTAYHFYNQYSSYPTYTTITYIYDLIKTSYYLKDIEKLSKWIAELDRKNYIVEGDKINIQKANIFYEKFRQSNNSSKLNSMAMSLIDLIALMEYDSNEDYKFAIRVFYLTNHFEAVEIYMSRVTCKDDDFSDLLFLGDMHLAKSRYILKLPSVNDEIEDDDLNMYIKPMGDSQIAKIELKKAKDYYKKMKVIAEKEDERLEIEYYSKTTQNRLDKVKKILNSIEG